MNEKVTKNIEVLKNWYVDLSKREQLIVLAGCLFIVVAAIQMTVIDPLTAFIDDQEKELELARKDINALPHVLSRYKRLISRRENIEQMYKSIELSEGAFGHLESLVKNKAGIPAASFDIKENVPVKFGNQYEQIPYTISFKITDYPRLISFLEEVAHGEKPLVISSLDMRKSRLGDHIRVNIQVNSVKRVG
jgi:hypothetical protein